MKALIWIAVVVVVGIVTLIVRSANKRDESCDEVCAAMPKAPVVAPVKKVRKSRKVVK